MSAVATPDVATPKKPKKEKSAKKRAREEEQGSERKHKRSKSVAPEDELPSVEVDDEVIEKPKKEKKDKKDKKEKKEKKHKKSKTEDETNGVASTEDAAVAATEETIIPGTPPKASKKKKSKRHEEENGVDESQPTEATEEKTKKKKKKSKHSDEAATTASQDPDAMEVDAPAAPATPMAPPPKPTVASTSSAISKLYSPPDMPPDPRFPFFSQTVSLYEPLLPGGWAAPITAGCESQHLRHLHNRYVPSLHGVLLDYSRVTLNDKAGRDGAATSDSDAAQLRSKSEFGGGFGWITADVRLFIPTRGAWMEGSINLQTEGHIGVVCFGRFNASIEAARLPSQWKWVPNELAEFEETASVITGGGADEHGVVRQIHSTGYWVDAEGDKVKGRVRFQIRNFDVGFSGTSTFLSLQGTMLDGKGEKALVAKEAEESRRRKQRKDGRQPWRSRVPEFSMTKFTTEEEAEAPVEEVPPPVEDTPSRDVVASVTANGDDGDE